MSDLRFDLRVSVRSLWRQRAFCGVVITTLALGIGAAIAVFSLVSAVLVKPLPYRDPQELALIWSRWNNFDKTWLSPAEYLDYRRMDRVYADVAAWSDDGEVALTGPEGAQSVPVVAMTANTLGLLGLGVARGRGFRADEDVPNGPAIALLGWSLWQGRYGGDPSLVGRTVLIDGRATEVVGILPLDFRLPLEFQSRATAQVVLPLGLDPATPSRGNHGLYGVARLRPGVTAAEASLALGALARGWTESGLYPADMHFTAFSVPVTDEVQGDSRVALLVLAVAVGLLLLLTCANVANLLLIRAHARSRESAVRAALGAGRAHILRLALTESLLLGLMGGALGLGLAWAAIRMIVARAPTSIPRLGEVGFDPVVLAFALVLSIGCGLVFGLLPALRASRLALAGALRDGAGGQSTGVESRRVRTLLVVSEMALAALLVIGAGLTTRSFAELMAIDPGFDPRGVLSMGISLPSTTYPDAPTANAFWDRLRVEVTALPGVEVAGLVRVLPIAATMGDAGLNIEGKPVPPGELGRQADWQAVSPGYFTAMRIPIRRGRGIDESDTPDGLPVIVINETLAARYFSDEDPIGRRIQLGGPDRPFRTVVGIVADNHHNGLTTPVKRAWFIPVSQWALSYGNPRRSMSLVVRATGDARALIGPVAAVVRRLDPDLPLTDVQTLDDVISVAVQGPRFTMALMTSFALLALVLAAVGVYGVVGYSVRQRTREIGIRLAMGSEPRRVRALVLRQGMVPAAWGVGIGVTLAFALSRFIRGVLYGVSPGDATTFLVVPAILLLVAAGAVLLPAIRASNVEPVEALRNE